MGIILFGLAVVMEVAYLLWVIFTKSEHDKEKTIVRSVAVVILAFLLAIGVLQGILRYGFFLFIVLIQAVLGWIRIRRNHAKDYRTLRQVLKCIGSSILYTLALLFAIVFPQYKEPEVTGDHEVVETKYTWVDESRTETFTNTGEKRAVTVMIWYPKDEGSYPLVVFSHGAFGMAESNTSTCKNLASNGYVAVSIAHPYHAAFVEDANGKITIGSQEFVNQVYADNGSDTAEGEENVFQFSREWMKVRTGDENFVLNTILEKTKNKEEGPFREINTEKIGLFGHSMGGATSVAVGRERDDIDAVIDIEGTMFGEYLDYKDGRYVLNDEPYTVPLLDINSREIYEQIVAIPEEKGVTYVNMNTGAHAVDFHEVVFNGVSHMNYTDLALISPMIAKKLCAGTASSGEASVDAREALETLNSVVLEYFDYYLKDGNSLNLQSEYL